MENQNLNQENQNQENQTNNQDPKPKKEKNPKRVAVGKKGAEARWKRMQAQQEAPAEQQEAPVEQETVRRETREPQETESTLKVNVYKNYIPLCAVLILGIGIFMLYNKSVPATQVTQPPQQSTPKSDIDPFEMN